MKIVLISPYGSLTCFGLRILSACLAEAGYDTHMIFLPSAEEVSSFLLFDPSRLYDQAVVDQVVALCSDAGLIGIGVMTNYFDKARQLTEALHQHLSTPVIWGGIHPTVRPVECLMYADMVCMGEGEEALVELANCLAEGSPHETIANLGYRTADNQIVINPPRALLQDLDMLPFPTFGTGKHYVLHDGHVQPLTPMLLSRYLMASSSTGKLVYPLLSSRGCPHRCSYCANDAYADLYPSWRRVRRRGNASLVAEIEAFREQFPAVGEVAFYDDVFVAAPTQAIEDLADLYKRKIDLPFYCIVSPLTINERKLVALLDAGLVKVGMGIETGSKRTQGLYNRSVGSDVILKAAMLFHQYAHRMLPPDYDVITDNPYEGMEDQLETLHLLQRIPAPYRLLIFSLLFYPGTALHERALADGLIRDEREEVYNRNYFELRPTYYNLIIYGYHRQLTRWLLGIMSHPPVFRLFSAPIWLPVWRTVHWFLKRGRILANQRRLRRFRRGTEDLASDGSAGGFADPKTQSGHTPSTV